MNTVVKLKTEAMIFCIRILFTLIAASMKKAKAVIIAPIIPPRKYAENSNTGLSDSQPRPKTKFFANTKLTHVPSK